MGISGHIAILGMVLAVTGSPSEGDIFEMVKRGDSKAIERLLAKDPKAVHARNRWGNTPRHEAAEGGYPRIVDLLIAHGAKVNARSKWASTPIFGAANPETAKPSRIRCPIWTFWPPSSPMKSPAETKRNWPQPFAGPTSEIKKPWRNLIFPSTPTSIVPWSWIWPLADSCVLCVSAVPALFPAVARRHVAEGWVSWRMPAASPAGSRQASLGGVHDPAHEQDGARLAVADEEQEGPVDRDLDWLF